MAWHLSCATDHAGQLTFIAGVERGEGKGKEFQVALNFLSLNNQRVLGFIMRVRRLATLSQDENITFLQIIYFSKFSRCLMSVSCAHGK